MQPPPTSLDMWQGQLRVRGWPADLPPLAGLAVAADGTASGRAGLRCRVRRELQHAGHAFVDALAPPPLPDDERPLAPTPLPTALDAWQRHGGAGLAVGLPESERCDLVLAAAHAAACRTLVVARDTGASHAWLRCLRERCGPGPFTVTTLAEALQMHAGRAPRHELLVVDAVDQLPATSAHTLFADSAAGQRLGFATTPHHGDLLSFTAWCGPLLLVRSRNAEHERSELHVPLTLDERRAHDDAWHEFLRAYDHFEAARPQAGFGTFVQQARGEPTWRPALLAWHRAQRIAAWNTHKRATVDRLLAQHRTTRLLVFTPDRATAYELARAHLIAPITAELPRAERQQLLDDFAAGRLRALVGPRLLDLGVHENSADVAILVGGGFGPHQRHARLCRVRAGGHIIELISEGTAEVGRVHRFTRSAVGHPAVLPARRR